MHIYAYISHCMRYGRVLSFISISVCRVRCCLCRHCWSSLLVPVPLLILAWHSFICPCPACTHSNIYREYRILFRPTKWYSTNFNADIPKKKKILLSKRKDNDYIRTYTVVFPFIYLFIYFSLLFVIFRGGFCRLRIAQIQRRHIHVEILSTTTHTSTMCTYCVYYTLHTKSR